MQHLVNWRNIAISLTTGVLSKIAFHEKAGRSQVGSFVFSLDTVFSLAESPLSPPSHPHSSRSGFVRSVQVGCSHFSRCHLIFDLPSILKKWKLGQAINAVTGTRLWAFAFPFEECFDFMQLPVPRSACCCATVRRLLRLPTSDAARPLAFSPWQSPLFSSRSFRRVQIGR